MEFKIENNRLGITKTVYSNIDLITDLECEQENSIFITPYNKNQHCQVINNKDEEHLTVWDKKTDKIIGFIILAGLENPNLSLEFRRIVIRTKGRGFGRQCLKLTKEYCFKKLKFHRLWLDVFIDNERAIALYKSEGFKVEGYLRDVIKQGTLQDPDFIINFGGGVYTEPIKRDTIGSNCQLPFIPERSYIQD